MQLSSTLRIPRPEARREMSCWFVISSVSRWVQDPRKSKDERMWDLGPPLKVWATIPQNEAPEEVGRGALLWHGAWSPPPSSDQLRTSDSGVEPRCSCGCAVEVWKVRKAALMWEGMCISWKAQRRCSYVEESIHVDGTISIWRNQTHDSVAWFCTSLVGS